MTQSKHEEKKKIRQISTEGYSTKYMTSVPQNFQGPQNRDV